MSSGGIDIRLELARAGFLLDVALNLPASGITGVFGRSGSGKTTLLRCIAGLEPGASGQVTVADKPLLDTTQGLSVPIHEREIGYVFQEPRLFRHKNVRGNLEFGSARRDAGSAVSFDQAVDLLGLAPMLDRPVHELSGGEAQRVSIGRALLSSPRLVLMDEPLASLDRRRKNELLPFLDRLHAELSLPVIYVSHSIDEICRLSDSLVVLDDGKVSASGDLQYVLTSGASSLFDGEDSGSVIETVVESVDAADELARLSFSGGELLVTGIGYRPGERLRLRVRASDVSINLERPAASSILNVLPAIVEGIDEDGGGMAMIRLKIGEETVLARVTRRSARDLRLSPGAAVFAQIKSAAIRNIPTAGHLDPPKEL